MSGYVNNLMSRLQEKVYVASDISKRFEVECPSLWPPFWSTVFDGGRRSYRNPFDRLQVPSVNHVHSLAEIDVHGMINNLRKKGIKQDIPESELEGDFHALEEWATANIKVVYDEGSHTYKHNAPIYWKCMSTLNLPSEDPKEVEFKCEGIKRAIIAANVCAPPKNLDSLLSSKRDQELYRKHAALAWRQEFRKWYNIQLVLFENCGSWLSSLLSTTAKPD